MEGSCKGCTSGTSCTSCLSSVPSDDKKKKSDTILMGVAAVLVVAVSIGISIFLGF